MLQVNVVNHNTAIFLWNTYPDSPWGQQNSELKIFFGNIKDKWTYRK